MAVCFRFRLYPALIGSSMASNVNHRPRRPLDLGAWSSRAAVLPCRFLISKRLYFSKKNKREGEIDTGEVELKTDQPSTNNEPLWVGDRAPRRWWNDPKHQRLYLDWLAEKLGFNTREAWYQVSARDFYENSGGTLLDKFGSSPYKLISTVYTDYEFLPWLFSHRSYFDSRENRVKYVEWLLKKVGVKSEMDLKVDHFRENGGAGLLMRYEGSPLMVINSLLPEGAESSQKSFLRWKPQGYWASIENQKSFLDEIGQRIGVKDGDLSAWYSVSFTDFLAMGGGGISGQYNGMYQMLSRIYPEYNWVPYNFKRTPRNLINDPKFVEKTLAEAESKLMITDADGWYRVSVSQLHSLGLNYLLSTKYGSLYETLKKYRPNHNWDESKFVGVSHFGHKLLVAYLRKIFPTAEILENAKLSDASKLTVTCLIPSVGLAFDYQKEKYYGLTASSGRRAVSLIVDEEKSSAARTAHITLISIPFWWDRSIESLIATIASNFSILSIAELSKNLPEFKSSNAIEIPTEATLNMSTWKRR